MIRRRAAISKGLALAFALSAAACGSDSLVGGGCREGLSECSLKCVDLRRDPGNCGACGHACGVGVACSAGVCGGTLGDGGEDASVDGGSVDGGSGGGSGDDGSSGDGTNADGANGDASSGEGGPTCTPPFDTPDHCGDCTTRCAEPTPVCGLQGTYKCLSRCEAPLVACGTTCVNTISDDKNCGMCGKVCVSGICQASMCVGKGFGHEIVIGMDYSDGTLAPASAQVTMLGNAVFQSGTANVRMLAYEEFADPTIMARVKSWLMSTATSRGRTLTVTTSAAWTGVPEELAVSRYDVFFVYDQLLAPRDQMATTGTFWNSSLEAFAKGGGIIVVLDGGSVGRMRDFLTNSGLLAVTDEADVTGTQLRVDAPTDVVGLNLPNVIAAKQTTVSFTTTQMADNLHVFVVKDGSGRFPVVVHSVPAQ